jgi:hypothetical protein
MWSRGPQTARLASRQRLEVRTAPFGGRSGARLRQDRRGRAVLARPRIEYVTCGPTACARCAGT